MFAHELCHSQVIHLIKSTRRYPLGRMTDFDKKDRAACRVVAEGEA